MTNPAQFLFTCLGSISVLYALVVQVLVFSILLNRAKSLTRIWVQTVIVLATFYCLLSCVLALIKSVMVY